MKANQPTASYLKVGIINKNNDTFIVALFSTIAATSTTPISFEDVVKKAYNLNGNLKGE